MQNRTCLLIVSLITFFQGGVYAPAITLPEVPTDLVPQLPELTNREFMESIKQGLQETVSHAMHDGIYYGGALTCFVTASGLALIAARRKDAGFNRKTACLLTSAASCAALGTAMVMRPDLFRKKDIL
jgi:hypothetical protein